MFIVRLSCNSWTTNANEMVHEIVEYDMNYRSSFLLVNITSFITSTIRAYVSIEVFFSLSQLPFLENKKNDPQIPYFWTLVA